MIWSRLFLHNTLCHNEKKLIINLLKAIRCICIPLSSSFSPTVFSLVYIFWYQRVKICIFSVLLSSLNIHNSNSSSNSSSSSCMRTCSHWAVYAAPFNCGYAYSLNHSSSYSINPLSWIFLMHWSLSLSPHICNWIKP